MRSEERARTLEASKNSRDEPFEQLFRRVIEAIEAARASRFAS